MSNNDKFIDQMDKANAIAQSGGYVNAIAWAKKAYESQTITQYDYKKFENLHHLRNLVAHGSACDIQISDDTMMTAYAFCKAVARLNITETAPQESYLLKEENRNQKRTYVKKGDFVLIYSDYHRAYQIFIWEKHPFGDYHLVPVDKYYDNVRTSAEEQNKIYELKDHDYGRLSVKHPNYVIPVLPDEVVLCNRPYIIDVIHIRDEKEGYKYDQVKLLFEESFGWMGERKGLLSMICEGYGAIPACFDLEEPLAFEDVKDCLKTDWPDIEREIAKRIV